MSKYCSENERMKREYVLYLEAASGRQSSTADAALRAIERFEISTGRRPFKKFQIEQARSFCADLAEEIGPTGKPLSAATVVGTLKHLRNFFLWPSREPGYRSAINANDAACFTPSSQDVRIAGARREKPVATVEQIHRTLSIMATVSPLHKRNRAVVAFALLSGARIGAIASLRIKHVDMAALRIRPAAITGGDDGRGVIARPLTWQYRWEGSAGLDVPCANWIAGLRSAPASDRVRLIKGLAGADCIGYLPQGAGDIGAIGHG
jgi:integrase